MLSYVVLGIIFNSTETPDCLVWEREIPNHWVDQEEAPYESVACSGSQEGKLYSGCIKGDLIALCSFLRRRSGEGGAEQFSLVSSDRMERNVSKLHCGRFTPGIKKHAFTERMVKHWNSLPKRVSILQIYHCSRGVWTMHLITCLITIFGQPWTGQAVWLDDHCRPLPIEILHAMLCYAMLCCTVLGCAVLFKNHPRSTA